MAGRILIGVSGWRYTPWRGHFYPPGLAQARELAYAAQVFPTLELNGSFYSLQRPSSYAMWARDTPPHFVFAVKGGRFLTHMLRLRHIEVPLANFFASGLFELGDKLGPILWQFPPNLAYDPALFEAFFRLLPKTTAAAAELAARRDARLAGRESLHPERNRRLRHAVEVRHASFVTPQFVELLRKYRIGWVVADTPEPWPHFDDVTADFVYVRLHGSTELYNSRYSPGEIARWAERIRAWAGGGQPQAPRLMSPEAPAHRAARDVYVYFDNTDKRHAPENARELMALLGLPVGRPEVPLGSVRAARRSGGGPQPGRHA